MTKPLVAFHWLRANGRQQEKQNKQTVATQYRQSLSNESAQPKRKFINFFKKRGK